VFDKFAPVCRRTLDHERVDVDKADLQQVQRQHGEFLVLQIVGRKLTAFAVKDFATNGIASTANTYAKIVEKGVWGATQLPVFTTAPDSCRGQLGARFNKSADCSHVAKMVFSVVKKHGEHAQILPANRSA
jgi:hypothetical protein